MRLYYATNYRVSLGCVIVSLQYCMYVTVSYVYDLFAVFLLHRHHLATSSLETSRLCHVGKTY